MAKKPDGPHKVTTLEIPYRSLVLRADPDFTRETHNEPFYEFTGRVFREDNYKQGPYAPSSAPSPPPPPPPPPPPAPPNVFGVGLSIVDITNGFGQQTPTFEVDYVKAKKCGFLRLPFNWEQIQPTLLGALDATIVSYIESVVIRCQQIGIKCWLDLHNYGRYKSFVLGDGNLTAAHLQDVWAKIVTHFIGYRPTVCWDIMNEPHDLPGGSQTWVDAAQATVITIRGLDLLSEIIINGYHFSSCYQWLTENPTLHTIVDVVSPENITFSGHQYPGSDATGGPPYDWDSNVPLGDGLDPGAPFNTDIMVKRLTPFVTWGQLHGKRLNIGEYGVNFVQGVTDNLNWLITAKKGLDYLQANNIPVSLWAAGQQWGHYAFSLQPGAWVPGATDSDSDQWALISQYTGAPQPTRHFLGGPSSGSAGVASGNFTSSYQGYLQSGANAVITPHAKFTDGTDAGGTFSPPTMTLAELAYNPRAVFTYTATATDIIVISTTNNKGWTDPPAIPFATATDNFAGLAVAPDNIYQPVRRIYNQTLKPALQIVGADGVSVQDIFYNRAKGLPRQAMQDFAGTRAIPISKIYGVFGNDMVFTGTKPILTLVNAAGYPEVTWPLGLMSALNTNASGKGQLTLMMRVNAANSGVIISQDDFNITYRITPSNFSVGPNGSTFNGVQGAGNTIAVNNLVGLMSIPATLLGPTSLGFALPTGMATGTQITSQISGTPFGNGVYGTNLAGTANSQMVTSSNPFWSAAAGISTGTWHHFVGTWSNAYLTNNLKTYLDGTLNAQTSTGTVPFTLNPLTSEVDFGAFRFGGQNGQFSWDYAVITYEEFSSARAAAFAADDVTYYSTALTDSLTGVAPSVTGAGARGCIVSKTSKPFSGVTIVDTNGGGAVDDLTLTLTGSSGGTLTGTGLSGSGPYTIAAASPASVTTTLRALVFTPSGTTGQSTTIAIHVNSSAGSSVTNSATVVTIQAVAPAETPFAAPAGTFTPINKSGPNIIAAQGGYPDTGGFNHIYPPNDEIDYWAGTGSGTIRVPLFQQRLQPVCYGPLDPPSPRTDGDNYSYVAYPAGTQVNLAEIKRVLDRARGHNMYVQLEIHQNVIVDTQNGLNRTLGNDAEATNIAVDIWQRLATVLKNYDNAIFEPFNEPVASSAAANFTCQTTIAAAIAAITTLQWVYLPTNFFSGGNTYVSRGEPASWNAWTPPAGLKWALVLHQYLNAANDGFTADVVLGKGASALSAACTSMRAAGIKAVLTETGWSPSDAIVSPGTGVPSTEGNAILNFCKTNNDVFIGWNYWLGGNYLFEAAWNAAGHSVFSSVPQGLHPAGTIVDAPQVAIMQANFI